MMWWKKLKTHPVIMTLLIIAPVLGAVITTVNFIQKWDEWQLPRPALTSDINELRYEWDQKLLDVQNNLLTLEIQFQEFVIRVAQRNLREVQKHIADLEAEGSAVPDNVREYQDILTQEIETRRLRLREIKP